MSLLYLFGKDNVKISGNPRFSFFEPCGKEAYDLAIINNKIATSRNFSLGNYVHKIEDESKDYNIDLSDLLCDSYDLLGDIDILLIINGTRFIQYCKGGDEKIKCKYILSRDL